MHLKPALNRGFFADYGGGKRGVNGFSAQLKVYVSDILR